MRVLSDKYRLLVFDLLVLSILLILFWYPYDLSLIFLDTHIAGGDTISHPWIARSLKSLWENGMFWGWNDSWGAGFPFLYFYFYPVYVLSNFFSFLGMTETVAFKFMVFFIVSLLPIGYYFSGKKWLSRTWAILFTALGFFLFFNGASSYFGGNFKSVLAGQMSHHFGLVCLVFYFSYLIKRDFNSLGAVFFLTLSVLSHVYSGIYAIFFTLIFWSVEYFKNRNLKEILMFLKGPMLGAALSMFFWLPLIYYRNDTLTPQNKWHVDTVEIIKILQLENPWFMFLYIFVSILVFINLFNKRSHHKLFYLALWILGLGSMLVMPLLKDSAILHIRLIPQVFLISILLVVGVLNEFKLKGKLKSLVAASLCFVILQAYTKSNILDKILPNSLRITNEELPSWWAWNMSGIENKQDSQTVKDLWHFIESLPDQEGRFAAEYFDYNSFGSPRIFELTPYMTGKSIFESLLMESSSNYPASYYINFLIKSETWWPGFKIEVPKPDIKKAIQYFSLFNMKYFIAHSNPVVDLMKSQNLSILYENKNFKVFEMNPETRIANKITGEIPTYFSEKPLYASVKNFPNSLATISKVSKGEESKEFPKGITQEIIPLDGHWADNKQRYVVPETGASENNPMKVLFKISYFPNWETNTGEAIQHVSPNLIMVETTSPHLEIVYRAGWVEKISLSLSIITLFALIWVYGRRIYTSKRNH